MFVVVITDFDVPGNDIEARVMQASGLPIQLRRCDLRDEALLGPIVAEADALLVQFAPITRGVIARLKRCRGIVRYGVGVDTIDVRAASEQGIPVANVPDSAVDEVSTQTLGFIIDLARRTWGLASHVREGRWGREPLPVAAPARLAGQTLGIVGLGRIGQAVAVKAAPFGLRVIATDPRYPPGSSPPVVAAAVSLRQLLIDADFVSLHCPLLPATHHLIGPEELALMKPTANLINMARGAVVDQGALTRALKSLTIAGAALDVLEREPPSPDEELLQQADVIITPHTASWSVEAAEQLRRQAAENVVALLRGQLPRSVINRAELAP